MTEILTRFAWGAVPPKSRTLLHPGDLKGVTVHWFGSPKAASSHAGCDDLLRGVQRGHMAPGGLGVPQGGADIAYNHAVCPHGVVYTLRGFGVKTGANGTSEGNAAHAAIVYMAGTGDPFTDGGKEGLNFLIAEWRRKGAGTEVSPHHRWTGSECPGPAIMSWLAAGRPQPTAPEVVIVEPWVPKFVDWYLFNRDGARPPGVPADVSDPDIWEIIRLAAKYRAEKPPDPSAVALKAKLSQIHDLSG